MKGEGGGNEGREKEQSEKANSDMSEFKFVGQ